LKDFLAAILLLAMMTACIWSFMYRLAVSLPDPPKTIIISISAAIPLDTLPTIFLGQEYDHPLIDGSFWLVWIERVARAQKTCMFDSPFGWDCGNLI